MTNLKYALINNGFFVFVFVGNLIGFQRTGDNLFWGIGMIVSLILAVAYVLFVIKVVYPKYPIYNQHHWRVTKVGWSLIGFGILLVVLLFGGHFSPYFWVLIWVICLLRDYFSVQKMVED